MQTYAAYVCINSMIAPSNSRKAAQTPSFQWLPLVISLLITLTIGFVASVFTRPQIPAWYAELKKPAFNPPNWAFPLAWTVLYILIATAAYLVWRRRNSSFTYYRAKLIYIIQLVFNFSWSIVFFGMHQILAALVIIFSLWISIMLNMYFFGKISKAACWLLLPYLLWVSFATILNFSIYLLNG